MTAKKDRGKGEGQAPVVAGEILPSALTARTLPLATLRDCRRFLAQCVRDTRAGLMPVSHMTGYAFAVERLARMVAVETIEERLDRVEAHLDRQQGDARQTVTH